MTLSRRKFLKGVAGGGGALLVSGLPVAEARMTRELAPEAVGFLYDATLCVGCKTCMVNCKKENSVPGGALYKKGMTAPPFETGPKGDEKVWDASQDLSGKTLSVIKVYKNGTCEQKDRAVNGYAFFKHQCLHCVTPACVSVCPAGAFRKDPKNGSVYYLADKCIGCRYCQLACPFGLPRYEWDSAWPEVRKCQLCHHRYKDGKIAACAEVCPTGATVFGKVVDLREEAKRRIALKPGEEYQFPIQRVDSTERTLRPVAKYTDGIYGLIEAGGTQNIMLSGIPFDLVGFRKNIVNFDLPSLTWGYIAKIPWVFAGVALGGTALYKWTHREAPVTHRTDKEGKP
jgi:Fe-S-cluster-containing dehydrogenase component